jgi:hypothetical protein
MSRLLLSSGFLVALIVPGLVLASNRQGDALRQQVKALRQEERTVVKAIRTQYESVVNMAKLDASQVTALRKALRAQENQYLTLTSNSQQRANIIAQYDYLRKVLAGEHKLDATVIHQLRQRESAHVKLVSALYKAKIAEMDNLIRVASKTGKRR